MSQYDEFQEKIINNRNKGENYMPNNNGNNNLSFDDDIDFGKAQVTISPKVEDKIESVSQKKQRSDEDDFPKNQNETQKIIDQSIDDDFPRNQDENKEQADREVDDFPISEEMIVYTPPSIEEKKQTTKKEESSNPIEKTSFSAEDFEKFKKDVSESINDVKKEIKTDVKSLVEEFSKTLTELKESIQIISNVSKPISELNVLVETGFEKMKANNKEIEDNLYKKLNHISQSIETEVQKNEKYIEEHEAFFKSTNYSGLRNEITKGEESSNEFIDKENADENEDFEDMGIKNKNQKSNANKKTNQKPLGFFGRFLAKIGF